MFRQITEFGFFEKINFFDFGGASKVFYAPQNKKNDFLCTKDILSHTLNIWQKIYLVKHVGVFKSCRWANSKTITLVKIRPKNWWRKQGKHNCCKLIDHYCTIFTYLHEFQGNSKLRCKSWELDLYLLTSLDIVSCYCHSFIFKEIYKSINPVPDGIKNERQNEG